MATQSDPELQASLDAIKSIPEVIKAYQRLQLYELIFGKIEDHYGKVDMLLAYKTYRDNEDFHQNFGRYIEALRAKLEGNDMITPDQDTNKRPSKSPRKKSI